MKRPQTSEKLKAPDHTQPGPSEETAELKTAVQNPKSPKSGDEPPPQTMEKPISKKPEPEKLETEPPESKPAESPDSKKTLVQKESDSKTNIQKKDFQ